MDDDNGKIFSCLWWLSDLLVSIKVSYSITNLFSLDNNISIWSSNSTSIANKFNIAYKSNIDQSYYYKLPSSDCNYRISSGHISSIIYGNILEVTKLHVKEKQ